MLFKIFRFTGNIILLLQDCCFIIANTVLNYIIYFVGRYISHIYIRLTQYITQIMINNLPEQYCG